MRKMDGMLLILSVACARLPRAGRISSWVLGADVYWADRFVPEKAMELVANPEGLPLLFQ